jgi:hypothetical protein
MSDFQGAVKSWLENSQYRVVNENEEVQGKSAKYTVEIHALSTNQEFRQWSKMAAIVGGVAFFALLAGSSIPSLAALMKGLGSLFGMTGTGFGFALMIVGLGLYFYSGNKVDEHVLVELKEYKTTVNVTQMQKFLSVVEDINNNSDNNSESWSPKYKLMFSNKGFSPQAITLAENYGVDCFTWNEGTDSFTHEVSTVTASSATIGKFVVIMVAFLVLLSGVSWFGKSKKPSLKKKPRPVVAAQPKAPKKQRTKQLTPPPSESLICKRILFRRYNDRAIRTLQFGKGSWKCFLFGAGARQWLTISSSRKSIVKLLTPERKEVSSSSNSPYLSKFRFPFKSEHFKIYVWSKQKTRLEFIVPD